MHQNLFPGLTRERLEAESLYSMLREEAGMVPHVAEETYESTVIDESMAKVLQCKVIRGDRTKF